MRIGIVSDTHFGYPRFYNDTINQGREAILGAVENSDIVIHAGDMFDTRLPSFETIHKVLNIFKEASTFKKPILAIHGNHERRIKGYINPVKLISESNLIKYLHGDVFSFEKDGERINILGIGSVPEEHSKTIIKKAIEKNLNNLSIGKNILVIHQMIKEFDPTQSTELSLSYIESLNFDLVINGHIHKRYVNNNSKLLIPGSTVVTSLDDNEISHKRGYVIYETSNRKRSFIEIKQKTIFSEELRFEDAGYEEVSSEIEKVYNKLKAEDQESIVRIKITGSLKEGLIPSLIHIPSHPDLYVKNSIRSSLKDELEKAKKYFNYENINKWAEEEIKKKLKEKIHTNSDKLLSTLYEIDDIDEAIERLLNEE